MEPNACEKGRKLIPVAAPSIGQREIELVTQAIKSGWVSSKGEFIELFERDFARFCGSAHGSTTANGTVALHLALLALGIEPGDEVIVPTFTFVGSISPLLYVGARPVFADVDKDHWCIDPASIEKSITPRTRAILVVHLYGHPAEMDRIHDIANKHNVAVIEDAAEAHGALYRKNRVGALSDVAIFSFYGNKVITTGEGGIVLSNNKGIIDRVNFLKNHGMDPARRYWHPAVGYNYRMTNLQAALGLAQLSRIEDLLAKKRQIQSWYQAHLDAKMVTFQIEMPWAKSACWMVSVLPQKIVTPEQRDQLIFDLGRQGIESRPLFYPAHTFPPYVSFAQGTRFPAAESISYRGINLPSGVDLSEEEVRQVCGSLQQILTAY